MKKQLYLLLLICSSMQAQFITGGYPVNINQVPYQASLQVSNNHICGCSILNNQWLLTAAHCVSQYAAISYTVKTGLTLLSSPTGNSASYNAQQIVIHPNYNSATNENDIALIKISGSISYNADTTPISLASPLDNLSLPGQSTSVSGWGWTTPGTGPVSNQLMMVNVPIINNSTANSQLDLTYPSHPNVSGNMIATSAVGGVRQGACHGDSGGPLVVTTSSGVKKQIGTVSWGVPTCVGGSNSPSIFAKVENYIPWINSYITPPIVYNLYGSNTVCSTPSQSFVGITPSPPSGSTIEWSTSSNLFVSSTLPPSTNNTQSVLVSSNLPSNTYSTGTVTATINGAQYSRTVSIGQKPFSLGTRKSARTDYNEYCDSAYHYIPVDIINSDASGSYSYTFGNFNTGISNPGITYTQINSNRFVFKIPLNKIPSGANQVFSFSVSAQVACSTTPYVIYGQVVTIGSCNGTFSAKSTSENVLLDSENTFTVYPNPATHILNIAMKDSKNNSVKDSKINGKLYDMNGQQKAQLSVINNSAILDVSKFKKGIYILKIEIDGSVENHQIIIE